jgi:hypothetical protein
MSTSSSRNPKELVDRYLQAVRFWVPRSQQDLVEELAEDLRSQIDDKETELGHPLDVEEVSAILKRCGSPMIVASSLGPRRQLIGPGLYPIYTFVLKAVLLWILVPVFIFIIGPVNLANSSTWGTAVARTMGDLWSGLFISAGIITLVFVIIERTAALDPKLAHMECKWDPKSLPPLQKQDRKPSLIQAVCEMVFGWFGLIWLLLVPHYPFLIFGPAASFLKAGPLCHTFYFPIVMLGVFGLLRSGMILAKPQWSWLPPLSQLMQTVLTLLLLNFIVEAVSHMPHGTAGPFVVLADSATESVQHIRVAAVVNVSILISIAGAWLGLSIAAVVQTWEFLKFLRRKRISDAHQPASMGVL